MYLLVCANCDVEVVREKKPRGPFCTSLCKEIASFIRHYRGVNRRLVEEPGFVIDEEIGNALKVRSAHILSGGYDENAHQIPATTRKAIWERDGGKCVACGKPGEEIDHIAGASADPTNLRLLCKGCHWAKTSGNFEKLDPDSPLMETVNHVMGRVNAPTPVRGCDTVEWATTWRVELANRIRPCPAQ